MLSSDREELIHALADQVGLTRLPTTTGSYYDSGTGTLYVSGDTISKATIQEAQNYFENMLDHHIVDERVKLFYKTAVESIKLMVEDD